MWTQNRQKYIWSLSPASDCSLSAVILMLQKTISNSKIKGQRSELFCQRGRRVHREEEMTEPELLPLKDFHH